MPMGLTTKVLVRGGLGNQMFQVAFGLVLAKRYGGDVAFVDFSKDARVMRDWGLSAFGVTRAKVSPLAWRLYRYFVIAARRWAWLGRMVSGAVMLEPLTGDRTALPVRQPVLVDGYWQHVAYYLDHVTALRKQFMIPLGEHGKQLQALRASGRPIVALHARRGDYISDPAAAEFQVCDVAYYRRAWDTLQARLDRPQLWVFSDDPVWAQANLSFDADVQFAQSGSGEPAWVDLMRMAHCDHFIISNSSYSWWAAFLSAGPDKQVVAPACWRVGMPTRGMGICPDEWALL